MHSRHPDNVTNVSWPSPLPTSVYFETSTSPLDNLALCDAYVLKATCCTLGPCSANFFTLKMEAIRSSETSVHMLTTRPYIPEDGNIKNQILTFNNQNLFRTNSFKFVDKRTPKYEYAPVSKQGYWIQRSCQNAMNVCFIASCHNHKRAFASTSCLSDNNSNQKRSCTQTNQYT